MANKRTSESSTLHIGIRYDTSDAKRDIRGLINNFELLQKESQIDVGLKNLEGVGGAIHEFKTLDGQLTDIADDSKLAGKQIDENISKAVNSAIDNISTLTGKTNDLLDLLRKIGRGEGSADDIKKLATDLQANLGLLGVKFDANEIFGMADAQQQLEALSKGVVQFASTWGVSAQGVIESNLGISGSLSKVVSDAKEFNKALSGKELEKAQENLDLYTRRLNAFKQARKDYEEKKYYTTKQVGVGDEESYVKSVSTHLKQHLESIRKAYDVYKQARKEFDEATTEEDKEAKRKIKDQAYNYFLREMPGFMKNLNKSRLIEEWKQDEAITLSDKLHEESTSLFKDASNFASEINEFFNKFEAIYSKRIENLENKINQTPIKAQPQIEVDPTPDPKVDKKVRQKVEQSIPDKVEAPVEVEVDAKPKIDDTKIINNLEDALKKFRDSKRKDNVAANEAAQLVLSLKDLGYGEDDIKQRLSTNGKRTLTSDAMGKAITQAEQLRKQLPSVSAEVDKLNRLLGEDVSADDKFKSFVKAVDSGEMSVEDAHNAIVSMKKELAKDDASPGIDKLKNALKQIFKIKDIEELQASWRETVAAVESGSKDWVDALADISKEETNIRNLRSKAKDKDINKFKGEAEKAKQAAADAKKEARKAQDELESLKRQQGSNIKLKTSKPSGTGTGGSGTGAGSGSGSGTSGTTPSQPRKPVTTPSVEAEIKDLEKLEGKVKEVETTIRTTKTQAFKDEQQVVESVVEAEKIKLGELEAKIVEVGNKIGTIGQGADGAKPTLSLYDQILERMKKIAEEKKKISKEPSNKKMDYISDEIEIYGHYGKTFEQAQSSVKELIESVKYLLTLDKSIPSQSHVFENGGVKDQRLADIIQSIRHSDAPWLSNWDEIITQIEARLISLITFIKNNDGKLEDFLSVDEISTLNAFGFDKLQKEFNDYCTEAQRVAATNRDARRSIEDITEDILILAKATGVSEKELDDLYRYLTKFALPRIEMGSPEAETTYVASKLGVAQTPSVSPTINEKTTAFQEEQSTVNSVVNAEIQDLNRLKKAIEKVTAAVNYKTKAFKEEQGVVDKVVGSEIGKLSDLKDELEKEVKIPSGVSKDENDTNNAPTIDSTLSSTLLELQKSLSAMIGSTDPTTQNTDADKGLSGIAKNVKAIYEHLIHEPEEKKPIQNDGVEDATSDIDEKKLVGVLDELTQVISKLQSWLNNNTNKDNSDELNEFDTKVITPLSQAIQDLRNAIKVDDDKPTTNTPEVDTTPEPKLTDTENDKEKPTVNIEGLNNISDNVVKIHDILSKKEKSDEQLATSLKNAADGLKDATKYIEEDAKYRNDTNQKYMDAANRLSTAEGRKTVLDQALTGTDMKYNGAAVDYAPMSNGKVKVSTVVEDEANKKLYDFVAVVDKVGQSVAPLVENGRRSQQVIEERRKALEAQTVAEQKATQVSEEKLANGKEVSTASNGTMSINVLDGVLKSTTKMYDDYSAVNVGNVPDALKDEYSDLLNLIKKIKEENRNLEKSEVESIEKTCKAIQNKIILHDIESQKYDDKLSKMKDSTIDNGTSLLGDKDAVAIQKNFDEIEERTKKLQEKLNESDKSIFNKEELKQEQKELDNLIAKTEKLITTAKANKSKGALTKPQLNQFIKAESAYNESDANSKQLNLPQEGLASLDRYKQKYQELVALKEKFQSSSKNDITEDDIKAWSRLTQELKECREEYEVFEKVASSGGKMMFASDEAIQNTESLKDEMIKLAKATEQGKASAPQWADEFNKLTMTFEDADNQLKTVIVTYDSVTKTLTKSIVGVKQTQSAWEKFTTSVGNKVREMGAYFATFMSFYEVVAVVRQGITYIREIDSALTELKKVTDETDESYNRFLQDMSKTANVIGSTVADLTTMSAEWARLGYSMQESAKLAESTAILMNVSEFDNATEASEALISTMQAFQYTADKSVHVVDILNEIGNNYAVSSDGLAIALQDSASALMTAGSNLEESVALIAAANKVVQDPSSVGSALRTISLRLRGTSIKVLEEMGEETDNVIESTSKLQEKIKALSGVDILSDDGGYKSPYEILKGVAEVYDQMDKMDQAAIIELMAGKNRANTLAAILTNFEDLENAYKDALDAEGSAIKENEAYLDSIQGRIDLFNNSLQTMWMNTISSDMVKLFVDMGTAALQLIDKIGGVNVALATLAGYAVLKFKFGGIFQAIGAGITSITAAIKGGAVAKMMSDLTGFIAIIKEGKTIGGMFANLTTYIGLADTALGKWVVDLMAASAINAGVAGTTTTLGFAFVTLKTAILSAASALWAFLTTNPVGWAILAATAIVGVVKTVDALTTSHKEYVEQLEETNKEIDNIRSKLDSLNSELETTKQRIEELENKGPLSVTENEELEKLRALNTELERQIQLEEAREKRARNRQAEQASGAFDTDKDFEAKTVIGTDGIYVTNEFEKKLDDIEKAKENMNNAEIALQEAINSGMDTESRKFKQLEKDLTSAQEDYSEAYSNWDEFMKNKESEYDGLEWFDEDNLTESQKKVNEIISSFANYNDRAEIMFGSAGAKDSALDRIFGDRGSDAGKAFLEEFNTQVATGKINVEVSELDDYSAAIDNVTSSVERLISKNPQLKLQLDSLGISTEDVARYFLNIDEAMQQTDASVSVVATDIASLTSAYESYTSALGIANEAIYEGQAISDEYYDSLKEYLGDVTVGEENFSDAIDTNNGKIVKNAKLLKDLINQKKKDQKATVSAAKAQSQLQYTKIVKQLQQAVKAMALDYKAYGYVTQATYKNISALRDQISSIKNAIREYALLELKLSDVTNAYGEFENAKNRDAELTYGDSLIEGIQALNDGFATGKVGTETFKAAVDLIVPPEAYEGLEDYQDRLEAMHDYVDKNPLFADWFTIDADGNFGIEFKNMAAFVQDMQNMDVFSGDDITGFNFADGINSIEDIVAKTKEFNNGIGATESTIVAMLSELSKYDARFGDLLSEITMTELDKALKNTTEDLDRAIAKQEQFFKEGKDLYGADASEYDAIQQEINNCSDAYNEAQKAIINNTNAWIDANNNVDVAKNKVADLTRELQKLKDSDTSTEAEIKIKTDELEAAKQELSEALRIKYELGEEPTQMDFQLTLDDIQSQIDNWKSENATLDVDVVPKLQQTKDGVWVIPAEIEADLSDSDKQKIQEYVDLINDEQGLAELLGLVETDPAVSELVQIKDILSEIANVLGISKKVYINEEESKPTIPVNGTELHENKPSIDNIDLASNNDSSTNATNSFTGFSDWSIDTQIAAANEALEEWANGIKESATELKESLVRFFTETLPEKWDEFWSEVGKWLDDVGAWAQKTGASISEFFNETLPKKWDEFWEGVGNFFESIPYAIGYLSGKIEIFFTETIPTKWNEFWDGVGSTLDSLKEDATILKDKIVNFFVVTIPQKWNEFWDKVTIFMSETAPNAIDSVRNKIIEFFTVTIPTKWNAFWDSVSEYISTNITPALSAFCDKVVEFFTVTIPEKWNGFWDSVGTFFGETIPTALENTQEGITTFFTVTLPEKWSEFWGGVSSWFGEKISEFLGFLDSIKNKFHTGREDATNGRDYNPSNASGASGARGNALAKGNAHSKSNTGLKKNENDAIVGELGPETVVDVDKGIYYTVGENGTEKVNLPKHAIIYNHKQTEELFKNGHTSRGKLTGGLSFAKGNAHLTPSNSDGYNHGLYGGYLSDDAVFKDTSRQWIDANEDWVSDFANAADGIIEAADSLSDSADSASETFEDAINWIDVLFTRIENNIAEQEAYLETLIDTSSVKSVKDAFYDSITDQLRNRAYYSLEAANYYRDKANAEMAGLPTEIQNKIKSGAIEIEEFKFNKSTEGLTDEQKKVVEKEREAYEKYVERINQAIEYYDKISEYEQQYYTTITEIADKAVEHQEDVAQGFENEIGLVEHLNSMLEAHNDLQETKEGFALEAYYDAQIDANEIMLDQYRAERDALQDVFDTEVRLGHVKVGSQQWFDMQQAIYDVEDAIIDTEASIEDLQNSINDLKWAKFDELINRFEYVGDEISNVIQLLSHDPDGLIMEELRDLTSENWATDSGLATIGMYAQEMERAQYVANQYAEAIKDLDRDYASGKYNETEYLSKLNELISAQYENIEKYHDAKDAIVELNSARVDAIRDGIEKEIDAYQELINKKKELLDREQDLHSFNNEVEEKEKNIADLRKQLAAMDGDTTAATTAKKKQLEAELIEAQKSLEESYYSHSMTERQNALDKEFESFEEEKNKEIETWEEWLKDSNAVIDESLNYVQENTQAVYDTLSEMGSQYGLTLSTTLTEPWTNGELAISDYSESFDAAVSAFTDQLDNIVLHWNDVTAAAEEAARMQAKAMQQEYKDTTDRVNPNKNKSETPSVTTPTTPPSSTPTIKEPDVVKPVETQKAISVGGKINAGSAKIYDYAGDTSGELQYYRNDPIYTVLQELNGYLLVRHHKLKSGYTGWFKKSDVKAAYASGTLGTKKDEWALIDELGEELVINAQNGKLAYLSKGSGVVPADLTEKLMNIALDPASALEGVVPKTKVPNVTANNFDINLSFDALVHADNVTQDVLPELKKVVRSEFSNMMKQVNAGLRRA